MKNLFKYSLALLTVALGFTACSDDDDNYTAGVPNSTAQVYFSNTASNAIEISADATSFEVPILRGDSTNELTVALNVTLPEGSIFTAPTEVKFEAGKAEGAITFTYDPAKIVFGKYDTITVAIADPALTTQYGLTSFTFTAGITDWGEWEYWNNAKTADYIYNGPGYFSGDDPNLPFMVRQNMITPNLYQFRLSHWGYDVDLVLNYDENTGIITIPSTFTGYTHSEYGDQYVADFNTFLTMNGETPEAQFNATFDKEQGIITLPLMYFDTSAWSDKPYVEYIYIDGYNRADLTSSVSFNGKMIDTQDNIEFILDVKLGADVTSANVALVPGTTATDAQLAAIADGSYENMKQIAKGGQVKFTANSLTSGYYTFVVIPFNGETASTTTASKTTYRYTTAAETWNAVSNGVYKYNVFALSEEAESFYEGTENATLYQSSQVTNDYYLKPWAMSEDGLHFTVGSDGFIRFYQSTGEHFEMQGQDLGEVFFMDLEAYDPSYTEYLGVYDEDTKTFEFCGAYAIPGVGDFGLILETFTLTDNSASSIFKKLNKKTSRRSAGLKINTKNFAKFTKK